MTPLPVSRLPVSRLPISRLSVACAIVAAWTVYGVLLGEQIYALRVDKSLTWARSLGLELSYCYTWALLTPLVWCVRRSYPLENARWLRSLLVHLPACVLFAAMAQTGEVLLLGVFGWAGMPKPGMILRSIFSTLDYGAVLYWVVLLVGQSFVYLRNQSLDQLQKADLQTQLAKAQLQALQMQMHPHFLFNALNSVSELIHHDPAAADRMVASLSELLRIFLRGSETQEVTLEQEIDFLDRYLAIQKIRFEERLSVSIRLDPRTLRASVPSLILQPLVENAIRHGIANRETQGWIEIRSCLANGRMQLRVADNGEGEGAALPSLLPEGTGLRNTRRRLATIYGAAHEFRVEAQATGGVQALITIPFRELCV